MKCQYCSKEIKKGSSVGFDQNWLYGLMNQNIEVPREKMDIVYFCDLQCLVKWQKQEGIYEACKRKSIERSGASGNVSKKSKLNKSFRYKKPKD